MRRSDSLHPRLDGLTSALLVYLGRTLDGRAVRPAEIAADIEKPDANLLPHLAVLVQERLVTVDRKRRYRISPDGLAFLDQNLPRRELSPA
jgi:DNA-binding IclR family transcriptional regulator